MNNNVLTYNDLLRYFDLDPDEVKPYEVRQLLVKNKIKYHKGKGNRPCTTIEELNRSMHKAPEVDKVLNEPLIEVIRLD